MPTSPPGDISSNARQRLLEAALELFARKGYAATSVRELVEHAGVTKPVLYYYFQNKAGLYLALIQGGLTEFYQTASQAKHNPGTTQERITAYCLGIFDVFVSHLAVARLIYSIYFGPPQGAPAIDFDTSFDRLLDDIGELLEQGMAAGELTPQNCNDAAWTVVALLNVAMQEQLCHECRPRLDRDGLQRMLKLLFKGLDHA